LRLSATPNGKDQISENRFQISEVRTIRPAFSESCAFACRGGGTAFRRGKLSSQKTLRDKRTAFRPHAVSRYGHTTRFFTIVHQQMPGPPQTGMQTRACSGSSRRVRLVAPGTIAFRGLLRKPLSACTGRAAARSNLRFERWWR